MYQLKTIVNKSSNSNIRKQHCEETILDYKTVDNCEYESWVIQITKNVVVSRYINLIRSEWTSCVAVTCTLQAKPGPNVVRVYSTV